MDARASSRRALAAVRAGLGPVLAGLCLWVAGTGAALAADGRHIVYSELGGNTLLGVNYERLLSRYASLRVGVGLVPVNEGGAMTAVCMPNLLLGSARHKFEAGVGAIVVRDTAGSYARPAAAAGYRFTAPGGFFVRSAVAAELDGKLWLTPALSFGKAF
jgi:hypothetical protein